MIHIKFIYYKLLKDLGHKIPNYIVLEYAKLLYINSNSNKVIGMCIILRRALKYYNISILPEDVFEKFNTKFCEAVSLNYTYGTYWWSVRNRNARIKAFDKLIKYYKKHKEYI